MQHSLTAFMPHDPMAPSPGQPPGPRIDVLIPVYNGARWLPEALRSIQQQGHAALHIHVVDDGSTDSTPELLRCAALVDKRIRIHTQANGGIVSALNLGLAFCSADFVARHDADDVAHPTRLATQLRYLLDNPGCVAVGAVARHIDAAGEPLGSVTELRPPDEADPAWLPAREPYLMHPLLLTRRLDLLAAGGYRSVLHAEDTDLYWRLRERGRLHNLPQVLADYRVHGGSISSASLHNGRLMAVSSQLAALSARRRQAGQADLVFDAAHGARLRSATSLQAMVTHASHDLTAAERLHLPLAVAAKLLELASYQPFEPDAADCRFIGQALAGPAHAQATPANQRALAAQASRAAVRLCTAGRLRDAVAVLRLAHWPRFAWRVALHTAVPASVRRQLWQRLHGWRRRVGAA